LDLSPIWFPLTPKGHRRAEGKLRGQLVSFLLSQRLDLAKQSVPPTSVGEDQKLEQFPEFLDQYQPRSYNVSHYNDGRQVRDYQVHQSYPRIWE